jgi:hypothetical protein
VARRSAGVLAVAAGGLTSAISWSPQTHVFAAYTQGTALSRPSRDCEANENVFEPCPPRLALAGEAWWKER